MEDCVRVVDRRSEERMIEYKGDGLKSGPDDNYERGFIRFRFRPMCFSRVFFCNPIK